MEAPPLFEGAFHVNVIEVIDAALAVRPVGAAGGVMEPETVVYVTVTVAVWPAVTLTV